MVNAMMFVGELIIATLLFAQAAVFRSRALTVLAAGYVLTALLLAPHALTFPGAFAPDGLFGAGLNTTGWLAVARRMSFPLAVVLYVLLDRTDSRVRRGTHRPSTMVFGTTIAAVALASAVTILATSGHDLLPPLFLDRSQVVFANLMMVNLATIVATLIAMAMLLLKRTSVLDMWLLVSLAAWLIETMLNLPLQGRFTLGFYCLFLMMLVSHVIVLLALIAEFNRLYARLALQTAARNREREARLMSVDAVAAAISHEVGQPLAAVTLQASAGLDWLTRPRPNVEEAIKSLRAIIDSGRRSFEVVKGIRAMFSGRPNWTTEFDVNELVRETVSLLGTELAAAKVSLQFALDEALPPVRANRTQLQQVLINLITNAIQSLGSVRAGPRRIVIRSAPLDSDKVLLEVSDTGIGISPEDLPHLFEAFRTTKANGTGIGLSLCRTIVEEHGGRIWASPGEKSGAIFHVQLPRRGMHQPLQ
jgi:signal transduction histidine kinase